MTRKTGNYDEYHLEWLKDPENAAAFLNAVIEDDDHETFLLALRDVAQAQGGLKATLALATECR
jgi:DNA-binding phage protein